MSEPGSATCKRCGQPMLYGRHVGNAKCDDLLATLNPANQVVLRESEDSVVAIPNTTEAAAQPSKLQFVYRRK